MPVLVDASVCVAYFRKGEIDLNSGLNGIGIPGLILAQNAKQNQCEIYSLDHHVDLMKEILEKSCCRLEMGDYPAPPHPKRTNWCLNGKLDFL